MIASQDMGETFCVEIKDVNLPLQLPALIALVPFYDKEANLLKNKTLFEGGKVRSEFGDQRISRKSNRNSGSTGSPLRMFGSLISCMASPGR